MELLDRLKSRFQEHYRHGKKVVLSFKDGLHEEITKVSLGAQNIIHEIEEEKCN